MLKISFRNQFKRELKKQKQRGKDPKKFLAIAERLANKEPLGPKHRNHQLKGNFAGRWECHIEPDWLLIYCLKDDEIIFERTGSHSDLFR
ncbi:MAG: type II toxin-antitoxin system YafQ family toxin [Waddliaceae bacterium]